MNHSLFKYCPKCGSIRFIENDFKSKRCVDCDFTYYFNTAASTAAFITDNNDRLLVAKRAKDPAKGTLDLPGGFVDLYETAEEAIIREIREETNLIVDKTEYLFSLPNIYCYSGLEVHTLDMFFKCKITDFATMKANDDVEQLFFLDKSNINPNLFGLTSIKNAIEKWLTY